jgi:serine/threonine protein kinase
MGRNSVSSKTNNRKLHSADGNQKYQIIKSIDEGGQTSQVYLAKDESGQLVALKVYNKNFRTLLESEVKSLARLNNSHMVRILNHGQDGRLYDCKKTK